MSAEHNIEMAKKLVECVDVIGRLRSALVTVEAWSDAQDVLDEPALRERLRQIEQLAADVKDIGLEI